MWVVIVNEEGRYESDLKLYYKFKTKRKSLSYYLEYKKNP